MDNNSVRTFSAMQEESPYKSFIKTILGKVYVTVWDNFNDAPTSILLVGDPKQAEDGCIIDVWSAREELFLRNMNKVHFKNGTLVEYTRPTTPKAKTIEESTDEELLALVSSPFLKLQNQLNKIDTLPVVYRLLNIARDNNKSEKVVRAIEARLSEIQGIIAE